MEENKQAINNEKNPFGILDDRYYAYNLLKVNLDYAFENPGLTEIVGYKLIKIDPIIQEKATS